MLHCGNLASLSSSRQNRHVRLLLPLLSLLLGCDPGPTTAALRVAEADAVAPPETTGDSPLIPAWSAAWAQQVPPFVADPAFYGESSWDDVRGRVVQHQMTVWRDRARLAATQGDLNVCAARYAEAVTWAEAHPIATGTGAGLHALYLAAARRDAARVVAMAAGMPSPESARDRRQEPQLDPGGFADFQDRHALRLRLVEAALDAADPVHLPDTWGLAVEAQATDRVEGFTAARLGALPTGDSWVDVAGEPGPAAIGRLEVLGLDDPAHRRWLEARAQGLNQAMALPPPALDAALAPLLASLDATPWTSAYYNHKAAINEAIRQLGRAGRYAEAAALIDALFPLHDQDFAAPNREGALRGIQGRLLAHAGDSRADATLIAALAAGESFLSRVDEVDGGAVTPQGPP